jgi:short-subunit dehydrogenase
MGSTALITGASGGIGAELARYHAARGGDLVLVARSEDKLKALQLELENAHKIKVMVVVADLAQPESADQIFSATEQAGLNIDILINNAGFGGHGKFHERQLRKDQAMMQVNIVSLVNLTHLYLQGMVQRNYGKILHVASTAAFLPGPLQAVYYATKSFVVSFSQAISQELEGTNVTSTALCPGAVATGFVSAGDLEGIKVWDKAATAESVAKCGYDAMIKGDLVKINEKGLSFLLNWIIPFLPRKTILKLSRQAMEKS